MSGHLNLISTSPHQPPNPPLSRFTYFPIKIYDAKGPTVPLMIADACPLDSKMITGVNVAYPRISRKSTSFDSPLYAVILAASGKRNLTFFTTSAR